VRLSYAGTRESVEQGLDRIARFLARR